MSPLGHRPPTLVDVAAAAGVSVATASRAINGQPNVKPATRVRVLTEAERLRFQPSHAAQTLRTRRANMIGLIVPDISSVFYATALRAAEHVLRRQGYTLFISDTEENSRLEVDAIEALLTQHVAGLILAPVADSAPRLRRVLARHPAPVVAIDNRIEGFDTDAVLHENSVGACMLTAHLIEHGHRRIAFIGGSVQDTSGGERLTGYRQALDAAGLTSDPTIEMQGDWSQGAGQRLMGELLALAERPSAVVVASYAMMVGALLTVSAAGLRVPDDVALVSFDDTPFWPVIDPAITALESRDYEVGRLAAELLLGRLRSPTSAGGNVIRVPARLLARRSCGCACARLYAESG